MVSIDMIALPWQTISLNRMLIDPKPSGASLSSTTIKTAVAAAIETARSRRAASRLTRRLLRRKMPSNYETLNTEGAQGHPGAIFARVINDSRPCAVSDKSVSGGHGDCCLMAFDGLSYTSLR